VVVIPRLIEAMRNPNEDLRLRIRRALSGLRLADCPNAALDSEADNWVPAKDELAVEIERKARAAQRPAGAPEHQDRAVIRRNPAGP